MLCPPKPDTNAKLFPFSIRSVSDVEATLNDSKLSIRGNRLKVYGEQTEPLVEHYRSAGLLRVVDGAGEMDAIYQRLRDCLGLNTA